MLAQRLRIHSQHFFTAYTPAQTCHVLLLALFFLCGMHTIQNHLGGEGLQIPFNNIGWIVISAIILNGILLISRTHQLRYNRLSQGLLISCILISLPQLYPQADTRMLTTLFGLWGGYLTYLAAVQLQLTARQKQHLLWILLCGVLIQASLALWQYYWLTEGNSFGYDSHLNRPYGIFFQPNLMASFMVTGTVIAAFLLLHTTQVWQRTLLAISITLTTFITVVLLSRTGWLALILVSPLILFTLLRQNHQHKQNAALFFIALSIGLLWGLAQNFWLNDITLLMADRVSLESARAYTYPQTLQLWAAKPLQGWGYGNFESAYLWFSAKGYATGQFDHAGLAGLAHAHNEILQLGAQGGIIPVLGLLLAALAVFHACVQQKYAPMFVALLIPLALHSQLEYPFYHSVPHWLMFVVLIALIDKPAQNTLPVARTFALRLSGYLLFGFTLIFMLTTLHTTHNLYRYEAQGRKDLSLVVNNINPIAWYRRLNFYLIVETINAAVATDNQQDLQKVEQWIKEDMRAYPRTEYYNFLAMVYHEQGKTTQLAELQREAYFLFPDDASLFTAEYFQKNKLANPKYPPSQIAATSTEKP